MALNAIPRLMNVRFGRELSTRILSHIYGDAITYPFLKPEWLGSFQREELVRVYLLSIGRDRTAVGPLNSIVHPSQRRIRSLG